MATRKMSKNHERQCEDPSEDETAHKNLDIGSEAENLLIEVNNKNTY